MPKAWVQRLHGGQLAIMSGVVSLLGYGALSAGAYTWRDGWSRAMGKSSSGPEVAALVVGLSLVLLAHAMGRRWARKRKLPAITELFLALWAPVVISVWALRSHLDASDKALAISGALPLIAADTVPPTVRAVQAGFAAAAGEFSLVLLVSGVVAVVLLYRWFGARRDA